MNPAIVRNIIYPAYRFIQRDDVFLRLGALERNQWLSRKELEDLQWEKLKLLLDYVCKNVPYYKQLFDESDLQPNDIRTPEDMLKIPILTKDIIRKNSDRMITTDPARRGFAANTGGSTGETLYFFKDAGSASLNKADDIRLNRWGGIDIGDKEAVFWGMPFDMGHTRKITDRIKQYMKNIIYFSTFDMSEQTMMKYAEILIKFKPKLIRGYPSALFNFADFIKKRNITDINPEVIISTGEKSFPFQKALIKEVFNSKIYELYGSNEFSNIACECNHHKGFHLIIDRYYIEVLKDGRPAEKGEAGEIIITDLYNYYMPFLRYKIGDRGILSDKHCSCGRSFPMLEEIEGRSFDRIITLSGKVLGGFFWTYISRAVPGINQFQIVQKRKGCIDFNIVPGNDFKLESTKLLEKVIKDKAGENFKVDFKIVDKIPLTPSGKLRFIVSEILKERLLMKSKIHKAVVTDNNTNYFDSVTIDEDLMERVNLQEYEKVLVVDNTNGSRLETIAIKGKRGSRIISMNGAAAHMIKKGDEVIIIAFTWTDDIIKPRVILVDGENNFIQNLEGGVF